MLPWRSTFALQSSEHYLATITMSRIAGADVYGKSTRVINHWTIHIICWTRKHHNTRDVSSETPNVTTKWNRYDLANIPVSKFAWHADIMHCSRLGTWWSHRSHVDVLEHAYVMHAFILFRLQSGWTLQGPRWIWYVMSVNEVFWLHYVSLSRCLFHRTNMRTHLESAHADWLLRTLHSLTVTCHNDISTNLTYSCQHCLCLKRVVAWFPHSSFWWAIVWGASIYPLILRMYIIHIAHFHIMS